MKFPVRGLEWSLWLRSLAAFDANVTLCSLHHVVFVLYYLAASSCSLVKTILVMQHVKYLAVFYFGNLLLCFLDIGISAAQKKLLLLFCWDATGRTAKVNPAGVISLSS